MLLRLLTLFTLIGMAAPHAGEAEDDDEKIGGEGFGKIVMFATVLGVIALVVIVAITVLSIFTDQFLNVFIDPEV